MEPEWLQNLIKKVSENSNFAEYSLEERKLLKNCGAAKLNESGWELYVAKLFGKRVFEKNSFITPGQSGLRKTLNSVCELLLAHKVPE